MDKLTFKTPNLNEYYSMKEALETEGFYAENDIKEMSFEFEDQNINSLEHCLQEIIEKWNINGFFYS